MKMSIRTKFILVMTLFFIITLVVSFFSAVNLNRLSVRNNAILKENHYSVMYAREMSEILNKVNHGIVNCYLSGKKYESTVVQQMREQFQVSLEAEKNNITEPGEDQLAKAIENDASEFFSLVVSTRGTSVTSDDIVKLQNNYEIIENHLTELSKLNQKAIEQKTSDASKMAHNALIQMIIIPLFCFLFALSFTISFSSYFNERFFQLYNGIKEIASSNFGQRLMFDGNDEFYEISLVFNDMAEKLSGKIPTRKTELVKSLKDEDISGKMNELRNLIERLKKMEEQANDLIANFEKKK